MPLFYHMERLQPPHKVRMSPLMMIKNKCLFSLMDKLTTY